MDQMENTPGKLLSISQYAQLHGIKKSRVAYWCNQKKLKGVVLEKSKSGGYQGYQYMIPADAEPCSDAITEKPGMVKASEYADMHGVAAKTVLYWCSKGMIEGVEKVKRGQGFQYLIPQNAAPRKPYRPQKKRKTKPKEPPKPKEPKPKRVWTEREISLHIRRFCGTRTYQQLAEQMGISVQEVRRRYDLLHDKYGI